jgi:hypothetical protein
MALEAAEMMRYFLAAGRPSGRRTIDHKKIAIEAEI